MIPKFSFVLNGSKEFARGLLDPQVLFVLSGSKRFARGLLDPEVLFVLRDLLEDYLILKFCLF